MIGQRLMILIFVASLGAVGCGPSEARSDEDLEYASDVQAVDQSALTVDLGPAVRRNCRAEFGVRICLRSDFERAIDLEMTNQSSGAAVLSHSFAFYHSTTTLFDGTGRPVGNELWEGSPVPGVPNPRLAPDEVKTIQFNEKNALVWVPLTEVTRICYASRIYGYESTEYGNLHRICVDKS